MTNLTRRAGARAALAFFLFGLGGCGRKPAHVDPPADADPAYPRTYPAPDKADGTKASDAKTSDGASHDWGFP